VCGVGEDTGEMKKHNGNPNHADGECQTPSEQGSHENLHKQIDF